MKFTPQILSLFQVQRSIFFVCPDSGTIVRLSKCHISKDKSSERDWLANLELKKVRLDKQWADWRTKGQDLQNEKGRRASTRLLNAFDTVFRPHKLSVQDARLVGHPVDYVLFKGLKKGEVSELVFMNKKDGADKNIQESLREVISKKQYRWTTFRLDVETKKVVEE